jgi:hypothetical protein
VQQEEVVEPGAEEVERVGVDEVGEQARHDQLGDQ